MFGDQAKDELYEAMLEFLKEHPVSELIDILRAAVQMNEGNF